MTMLVISLALNGYQFTYKHNLDSHQNYAERIGANYLRVTKPIWTKLGTECCWLKLYLAQHAMTLGYDSVLLLDADANVCSHTPDIRQQIQPDKYIYMAKGYTHRFNSGVMLLVNDVQTRSFVRRVIRSRLMELADWDSVGWGENGHIIFWARKLNIVQELASSWNNTFNPNAVDYIRHLNHGPLRTGILCNGLHKLLTVTMRAIVKFNFKRLGLNGKQPPTRWFVDELKTIIANYPILRVEP